MTGSTAETLDHIRRVNALIIHAVTTLLHRAMSHDSSNPAEILTTKSIMTGDGS